MAITYLAQYMDEVLLRILQILNGKEPYLCGQSHGEGESFGAQTSVLIARVITMVLTIQVKIMTLVQVTHTNVILKKIFAFYAHPINTCAIMTIDVFTFIDVTLTHYTIPPGSAFTSITYNEGIMVSTIGSIHISYTNLKQALYCMSNAQIDKIHEQNFPYESVLKHTRQCLPIRSVVITTV